MKNIIKTVIIIIMYLLGVFLILGGITDIFNKIYLSGILIVVSGLILLPVVSGFIGKKIRWSFKKENTIKVLVSFIIFFFSIVVYPFKDTTVETSKKEEKSEEKTCERTSEVVDDEDIDLEKLECYEFGKVLSEMLMKLEVDDVKNMHVFQYLPKDNIKMIIEGGIADLRCTMYYDEKNKVWYISEIEDNEKGDIKYFVKNNYIDYEETILRSDIYSYKTQSIIEKSDDKKREDYYAKLEQDAQNRQKEEKANIIKQSQEDIAKIYSDFNNNKLSAEKKHKGKEYTFVGYFKSANNDGIINQVAGLISVEIVVKDGYGQEYLLYCDFDSDDWKEKLITLNNGDEVILKGKCFNWGNWSDCEIVE